MLRKLHVELKSVTPRDDLHMYAGAEVRFEATSGPGRSLQQAIFDVVRSGELSRRLNSAATGGWAGSLMCMRTVEGDCDRETDFK